jgi:hypothetical protein
MEPMEHLAGRGEPGKLKIKNAKSKVENGDEGPPENGGEGTEIWLLKLKTLNPEP